MEDCSSGSGLDGEGCLVQIEAMSDSAAIGVLKACRAHGVREFVVCGGSRNAPLVAALLHDEDVRTWNHFEERGAGFFALGRSAASGDPCAVVTTSGTAVAELLPSVVEAHYQARPLVLLTADRPARFRGSGAPQAIEQVGIFGPYASTDWESWSGRGPLHVNVELEEDEPLRADGGRGAIGEFNADRLSFDLSGMARFLREDVLNGLAVLLGGLESREREEVYHFLKVLGAPVVADATSGMREALGKLALADGDRILRDQPPGKVLRLGDVPVGRFWRDLEDLGDVEVFSVTRTGFSGLARASHVIHGEVDRVVRGLGEIDPAGDVLDHTTGSQQRVVRLDELLERFPDSEPSLMRQLSVFATMGESLFLGNSLPIREWNDFAQRQVPVVDVRASRGANGIDGQISTWLGATAGRDGAWGVFGDLTSLYDLSAPALLEQAGGSGRVLVVVNNGGGRIFERLPRFRDLGDREARIMANAHRVGFESWASMWGLSHVRVGSRDLFEIEPGAAPALVEICPDPDQTRAFWEAWRG